MTWRKLHPVVWIFLWFVTILLIIYNGLIHTKLRNITFIKSAWNKSILSESFLYVICILIFVVIWVDQNYISQIEQFGIPLDYLYILYTNHTRQLEMEKWRAVAVNLSISYCTLSYFSWALNMFRKLFHVINILNIF